MKNKILLTFLLLMIGTWSILLFNIDQEFLDNEIISTSISDDYVITSTEVKSIKRDEKVSKEIIPDAFQLDIEYILQNPELPTGCESTSLAIVLRYLGYDVDKMTIANNYLPKGQYGINDPEYFFVGDPTSEHGFGCYAPAIEYAANCYLKDNDSDYIAKDISGSDIKYLMKLIYKNRTPVIFWGSISMTPITEGVTWNINGRNVTWRSNNHCLVLIGWDETSYIFSDPFVGITEYPKDIVKTRYEENQRNCVIILKKH